MSFSGSSRAQRRLSGIGHDDDSLTDDCTAGTGGAAASDGGHLTEDDLVTEGVLGDCASDGGDISDSWSEASVKSARAHDGEAYDGGDEKDAGRNDEMLLETRTDLIELVGSKFVRDAYSNEMDLPSEYRYVSTIAIRFG